MHPDKNKLKSHVEEILDESSDIDIRRHLGVCEFCRKFCENYKTMLDSGEIAGLNSVPFDAWRLADRLYDNAIGTGSIPLLLFDSEADIGRPFLMAADGGESRETAIENLANLYSENPEIVMRIMRDKNQSKEFLQLISDDQTLVSNVMVQLPDLDKIYITDDEGIAEIESDTARECQKLKWQIRLSSTVFQLEPLTYDPEKIESFRETILENEKGDKIQVHLLKKTEGLEISFKVLEIEGNKEYRDLKAIVSQDKDSKIFDIIPAREFVYKIRDSKDRVKIRIFAK